MNTRFAFAVAACLAAPAAHACSACGCLLSTDWASQGFRAGGGWSLDLRQDFAPQTQLRRGSGSVDRNAIALPADEEIQRTTLSRTTTLALDYAQGDWGVTLKLPYLLRTHDTVAEGDTGLSFSRSSSLGDMRITARYAGLAPNGALGLTFGVKLPTGRHDVAFSSGPQQGAQLDRGLQPGSGTTDALLGAYHFGAFSDTLGYFVQAEVQWPLNSSSGFKPARQTSVGAGVRYSASEVVQPQVQLNLRHETRESGTAADVANSGFTALFASPGVTWQLSPRVALYGFVQVPLAQRVNGLQLMPRYNLTVGVHADL
ncbi:MAG: hypothetical protein KGJ44_06900 [Betaproteobacteria bacterium]|nr:hypothetical protein [Betaproteobacteria bacterium]